MEGTYLPELPPLVAQAIHRLCAPMGSGKTWRIGKDWVAPWKAQREHFVIVLTPLNSLGEQTAQLRVNRIANFVMSEEHFLPTLKRLIS